MIKLSKIYTIGHSQHKIEHFLQLLKMHNINYVIDVRSTPYSKYAQTYDRENITRELKNHNINYAFMGKYFGARQDNKELYTKEGYLDFEKFSESYLFNTGLQNVIKGTENNKIALMCLEKKPIDCHRAILVANAFYKAGCEVGHILEDGRLESHEDLNSELLNMYFPDRNQISMFVHKTEEEFLKEAYRCRNKDIGYHIEER